MKAKLFYPSTRVPRPTNARTARVLLPLLLITLALLLAGSSAEAHGIGYYQIRGVPVASYSVHAWIAPGVMRTGDVHIDVAVLDGDGNPALGTLVRIALIPLDGILPAMSSLAGSPDPEYPYARGASFRLDAPGKYRLEVAVSDANGESGITSADLEVTTIGWPVKVAILIIFLGSAATGLWLLWQTKAFWMTRSRSRAAARQLYRKQIRSRRFVREGIESMKVENVALWQHRSTDFMQKLNTRWHAPALWFYMLVIVAHWLEHVLQIYQIYGLGWEPSQAGGILGVIYPQLVESETLHFVYDFIQWAGIILLLPGFAGRGRLFWSIAMVVQTWHYIEHVLLMGQYLTGYYLFGAPHQISILQLWFPRAELHFTYNLLVFIPMVIGVHYYLQPKLAQLAAMQLESAQSDSASESGE